MNEQDYINPNGNYDPRLQQSQINSSQQQSYGQQPYGQQMPIIKPDNHLVLAIFTTICCCLPFGIVAIVKATKVDSYFNVGQYQAAQNAADEAKKWSLIGIGIGFVVSIIYIAIYGFAILSEMS